MLSEALVWLFTPAGRLARRAGHLSESIAITAREQRCRAWWKPHLAASRRALLESARQASSRRVALVLGSGPLLDVPLAELSELFEEVWLVDLVHPWRARWQARRHANVRLIEHDVTECYDTLPSMPPQPNRFLDEGRIDWVASVNLLSQLPNLAEPWLRRHFAAWDEARIQAYAQSLMSHHLASLGRFHAPVCLLTDVEQVTLAEDGRILARTDFQAMLGDWAVRLDWRWDIAPPGELSDGLSRYHRVAALIQKGQREHQDDVCKSKTQVDPYHESYPVQRGGGNGPVFGGDRLA
jgi:hypothetical protein